MKIKIIILLFLCISSCSNNPVGPPPVTHFNSFGELIQALETPAHTARWLEDFTVYDLDYNTGWTRPHNKDLAWELAYSLWSEYHDGYSRGVCGQFASLYVVAARTHGYECGVIVGWLSASGHALGWVKEGGMISITDNILYYRKKFKNIEEMKAFYRSIYLWTDFYNEYFTWEGN